MEYSGKLVLVVGVSGSGKGALISAARAALTDVVFPLSYTTRAMRPGEVDGENYHFATDHEFDAAVAAGDFLEWVAIDGGKRYGTLKEHILRPLTQGKTVVREVEVHGARRIRELLPQGTVTVIYVQIGSWEQVKQRILSRAPMSELELARRQARYQEELAFRDEADVVIDNPDGELERAKDNFIAAIEKVMVS